MENKDQDTGRQPPVPSNKDKQGVDKAPGEEQGKAEKVNPEDLKGKKTDRDFTRPEEGPLQQ